MKVACGRPMARHRNRLSSPLLPPAFGPAPILRRPKRRVRRPALAVGAGPSVLPRFVVVPPAEPLREVGLAAEFAAVVESLSSHVRIVDYFLDRDNPDLRAGRSTRRTRRSDGLNPLAANHDQRSVLASDSRPRAHSARWTGVRIAARADVHDPA